MSSTPVPDATCSVPGCRQPAAVAPPAVLADDLVEEPAPQTAPLCARHAAEAEARKSADTIHDEGPSAAVRRDD